MRPTRREEFDTCAKVIIKRKESRKVVFRVSKREAVGIESRRMTWPIDTLKFILLLQSDGQASPSVWRRPQEENNTLEENQVCLETQINLALPFANELAYVQEIAAPSLYPSKAHILIINFKESI